MIRCQSHPEYTLKVSPSTSCPTCWTLWNLTPAGRYPALARYITGRDCGDEMEEKPDVAPQ